MAIHRTAALAFSLVALAATASAYPGGTPAYVTDIAPFCASCHSSASEDQLQGLPPARASSELAANKHLAKIRTPPADSPYAKLSAADREALAAAVEKLDAATSVKLTAPATAKAGAEIEVVVETVGGSSPVLGVALVDAVSRFQAAPASSRGWTVTAKPVVIGPDGKPQTKFTDGRNPSLPPGTSYVNIDGIGSDAGKPSTTRTTWKLRAPLQAGKVPLVAVLLYGTETGSPHGAVETPYGKQPLGGFTGSSGRVKFSAVATVDVQ
jgi:cytochrome c553